MQKSCSRQFIALVRMGLERVIRYLVAEANFGDQVDVA
jgi:hypothetical protein